MFSLFAQHQTQEVKWNGPASPSDSQDECPGLKTTAINITDMNGHAVIDLPANDGDVPVK